MRVARQHPCVSRGAAARHCVRRRSAPAAVKSLHKSKFNPREPMGECSGFGQGGCRVTNCRRVLAVVQGRIVDSPTQSVKPRYPIIGKVQELPMSTPTHLTASPISIGARSSTSTSAATSSRRTPTATWRNGPGGRRSMCLAGPRRSSSAATPTCRACSPTPRPSRLRCPGPGLEQFDKFMDAQFVTQMDGAQHARFAAC